MFNDEQHDVCKTRTSLVSLFVLMIGSSSSSNRLLIQHPLFDWSSCYIRTSLPHKMLPNFTHAVLKQWSSLDPLWITSLFCKFAPLISPSFKKPYEMSYRAYDFYGATDFRVVAWYWNQLEWAGGFSDFPDRCIGSCLCIPLSEWKGDLFHLLPERTRCWVLMYWREENCCSSWSKMNKSVKPLREESAISKEQGVHVMHCIIIAIIIIILLFGLQFRLPHHAYSHLTSNDLTFGLIGSFGSCDEGEKRDAKWLTSRTLDLRVLLGKEFLSQEKKRGKDKGMADWMLLQTAGSRSAALQVSTSVRWDLKCDVMEASEQKREKFILERNPLFFFLFSLQFYLSFLRMMPFILIENRMEREKRETRAFF